MIAEIKKFLLQYEIQCIHYWKENSGFSIRDDIKNIILIYLHFYVTFPLAIL